MSEVTVGAMYEEICRPIPYPLQEHDVEVLPRCEGYRIDVKIDAVRRRNVMKSPPSYRFVFPLYFVLLNLWLNQSLFIHKVVSFL